MPPRPLPRFSALFAALALSACASQTPAPRTNLDPLFRAPSGTGEYPVDPATLERQAHALRSQQGRPPLPEAAKDAEAPCKHTFQPVRDGTHAYVDRDGSIALCTPHYCTQCGLLIHECQRRGR